MACYGRARTCRAQHLAGGHTSADIVCRLLVIKHELIILHLIWVSWPLPASGDALDMDYPCSVTLSDYSKLCGSADPPDSALYMNDFLFQGGGPAS